mmetsp:Transcript_16790/g.24320  ORF Transcript_16790/g.24320 Transcript_16790/m.24320 type:complete len:246 (+) Transcript_16790:375-1112(+)
MMISILSRNFLRTMNRMVSLYLPIQAFLQQISSLYTLFKMFLILWSRSCLNMCPTLKLFLSIVLILLLLRTIQYLLCRGSTSPSRHLLTRGRSPPSPLPHPCLHPSTPTHHLLQTHLVPTSFLVGFFPRSTHPTFDFSPDAPIPYFHRINHFFKTIFTWSQNDISLFLSKLSTILLNPILLCLLPGSTSFHTLPVIHSSTSIIYSVLYSLFFPSFTTWNCNSHHLHNRHRIIRLCLSFFLLVGWS